MALRQPQSMEELVYRTVRDIGEKGEGEATVWVFKEKCPKCKKVLMGKPRDKNGKVLIRAKTFKCPECGYELPTKEYEESLVANIEYTCPACKNKGEVQVPFKRKRIKGVDILRGQCQKCSANIDVTKKMK